MLFIRTEFGVFTGLNVSVSWKSDAADVVRETPDVDASGGTEREGGIRGFSADVRSVESRGSSWNSGARASDADVPGVGVDGVEDFRIAAWDMSGKVRVRKILSPEMCVTRIEVRRIMLRREPWKISERFR